jgi:RNA recognition motif-containing protein
MSEAEAQGIQQAEGIGYSEGEQVADQQETPQDGQAMKNRTKKIFVGGVPTDMEQTTIEDYFKEYGEVNS